MIFFFWFSDVKWCKILKFLFLILISGSVFVFKIIMKIGKCVGINKVRFF